MNKEETFLIDENIPLSTIEFLRSRGFKAYRLGEVGLKGAKDGEVAKYAYQNNLTLITLDKDFGYIYYQLYRGRLSVILI